MLLSAKKGSGLWKSAGMSKNISLLLQISLAVKPI
jgi:hypothetical protein